METNGTFNQSFVKAHQDIAQGRINLDKNLQDTSSKLAQERTRMVQEIGTESMLLSQKGNRVGVDPDAKQKTLRKIDEEKRRELAEIEDAKNKALADLERQNQGEEHRNPPKPEMCDKCCIIL